MKRFLHFIKKPHPFIFDRKSILLPGVITFLLITAFAPFGLSSLSTPYLIAFALLFGIIASLCTISTVFLHKWLLPKWSKNESWTLGKEILLILFVVIAIALVVFLAFMTLDLSTDSGWSLFQSIFLKTIIFSIFPVIFIVLIEQYSHQQEKLKQAKLLTDKLRERSNNTASIDNSQFVLEADNGKPELQLKSEELLFLKSDGNYIEVYFFDASKLIKTKLIRNRLKAMADMLDSNFFFCHKSHIVNLNHIQGVEGNARNLELLLRGTDQKIPVSRAKADQLLAQLKQ